MYSWVWGHSPEKDWPTRIHALEENRFSFLRSHELSIIPREFFRGVMNPIPLCTKMLTDFILHRFHAGSHDRGELMCTEDSLHLVLLISGSDNSPITLLGWYLSLKDGVQYRCLMCGWKLLLSTYFITATKIKLERHYSKWPFYLKIYTKATSCFCKEKHNFLESFFLF